jgi:hypothetical protein
LDSFTSIIFCSHRKARVLGICWVGMLVYIFVMLKEANRVCWLKLIWIRSSIRCTVFMMLKAYGSKL